MTRKAPKVPPRDDRELSIITLTPEHATKLLEHNKSNRPCSDSHVKRLAAQINEGKWRFNGDTIKITNDGEVMDGQHRLWAVIVTDTPIETVVVNGVEREAFSTIDTLRKPRSGGDVIALAGEGRYRNIIAAALAWLLRWQRKVMIEYRQPQNRIENSDIELAYESHPGIRQAVERARTLRSLVNQPILAFLYYALANRNEQLAERMIETLIDPAGVAITDPFYKLRAYLTTDHHKQKDPVMVIAIAIKAINAAHKGERINLLSWKNQGSKPEEFPVLKVN